MKAFKQFLQEQSYDKKDIYDRILMISASSKSFSLQAAKYYRLSFEEKHKWIEKNFKPLYIKAGSPGEYSDKLGLLIYKLFT